MTVCRSIPGSPLTEGASRDERLIRIASLGLRLKLAEEGVSTDNIAKGVFRFTGLKENDGPPRDGPQRSEVEPPDVG